MIVDCAKESFQNAQTPVCQNEPDSGIFPLLSGFVPPSTRFNPYTKKVEDNQELPYGARPKTEKSMTKFITSNLPNFVLTVSSKADAESKLSPTKHINKVVLYTEKTTPPVLFKALATHFKDHLDFYFVDVNKHKKIAKKHGVKEYPTIKIYSQVD